MIVRIGITDEDVNPNKTNEPARSTVQMAWIQRFKFNFNVAPPGKWPRNRQLRDQRHNVHSIQNWSSGGDGCNDSSNRVYDQGHGEHRRDIDGNRGGYFSTGTDRNNSTTRRRVGFDGPDRSPESSGSRGDKSYQDFKEFKRWKDDNTSISHWSRNEEEENDGNHHKYRRLMFRG